MHRKGDTNMKRNVVFIVIGVLLTCVIIAILGRVSQNYWGDKRFASKEEFQAFAQKEQVVLEDQGYFAIKKNGRTILGYPTQDGYIWDEFPFQPNNCKVLADHNSKKEFSLQDAWMDVSLCAQIDNKDVFLLSFIFHSDEGNSEIYSVYDRNKRTITNVQFREEDENFGIYNVFFIQDASEERPAFYVNENKYEIEE